MLKKNTRNQTWDTRQVSSSARFVKRRTPLWCTRKSDGASTPFFTCNEKRRSFEENSGGVCDRRRGKFSSFLLNKQTEGTNMKMITEKLEFSHFPNFFLFVLRFSRVTTHGLVVLSATLMDRRLHLLFCLKYKTPDVSVS